MEALLIHAPELPVVSEAAALRTTPEAPAQADASPAQSHSRNLFWGILAAYGAPAELVAGTDDPGYFSAYPLF